VRYLRRTGGVHRIW